MSTILKKALPLGALIALGLGGCGGGVPAPSGQQLAQVAQSVARKDDRVSADDLARRIIAGTKDFVLIDVRPPEAFAKGHIEGARNLSVSELLMPDNLDALPRDREVILYSQGSELAAQAAVLLRLAGGHDARLLLGGYNHWAQKILNPAIEAVAADGEFPRVPEQQAVACYFVGGDQVAQASPVPAAEPAAAPAYVPPVATPEPQRKPRKYEGC